MVASTISAFVTLILGAISAPYISNVIYRMLFYHDESFLSIENNKKTARKGGFCDLKVENITKQYQNYQKCKIKCRKFQNVAYGVLGVLF